MQMNRTDQIAEIRVLMDLVARSATSLAPTEMQLDASVFIDPGVYQRETTALFRQGPLCVGPSCLLKQPGDFWTFDDTGVPILLVRNTSGTLKGFVNICSHRSAPVAVGSGSAKAMALTCPYHGWTYTLDGRLRSIPYGKEGFPCVEKSERGLLEIPVVERDGLIFLIAQPGAHIDANAVDGGIAADLKAFGLTNHHLFDTVKIPVRQNWKSLMEGYHEFYHFAVLHPNTIAAMTYSNCGNYRQFGRHHRLSAPKLTINSLQEIPEAQWSPREHMSFVYYLFPATVFFVVHDHYQLWRVYPVDEQNSVVYQSLFLPSPPADAAQEQHFRDFFNMITKVVIDEDYWMGQMVQKSFDSGINRSCIIGRNEIGVQNMHRQIADVMGYQGFGETRPTRKPSMAAVT
jgi:carnitine monooxygenase subunit